MEKGHLKKEELNKEDAAKFKFVGKVFDAVVSITERFGKALMSPEINLPYHYPHYVFELLKFGNFSFKTDINRGIMPGANRIEIQYHHSEGFSRYVLGVEFRRRDDLAVVFIKSPGTWTLHKFDSDERWQRELLRDLRTERVRLFAKRIKQMILPDNLSRKVRMNMNLLR